MREGMSPPPLQLLSFTPCWSVVGQGPTSDPTQSNSGTQDLLNTESLASGVWLLQGRPKGAAQLESMVGFGVA